MTITIDQIEAWARIGVPDAERASPQRLLVTVKMTVGVPGRDELDQTVDYAAVAGWVRTAVETGERKLVETLARELAEGVRERFGAGSAWVEVRKFILPGTRWVAVTFETRSDA